MSRIDAHIATQVADFVRPAQASSDQRSQAAMAAAVRRSTPEDGPVSAEEMQAVAARLKKVVEVASGTSLAYKVDDETQEMIVELRDRTSDQVIRQIPSEEVLQLRKRLDDLLGILIDKKA